MASSRSIRYLNWMADRVRGKANYATSTSPKTKPYSGPGADFGYLDHMGTESRSKSIKGDFVPVYVSLGLIILQLSLGFTLIKQQLLYSPNVRVKKKLRDCVPEVTYPDKAADEGSKYIEQSWFRKIAHIQEFNSGMQTDNYIRKDPFPYPFHAETLKDVGIDPQKTP